MRCIITGVVAAVLLLSGAPAIAAPSDPMDQLVEDATRTDPVTRERPLIERGQQCPIGQAAKLKPAATLTPLYTQTVTAVDAEPGDPAVTVEAGKPYPGVICAGAGRTTYLMVGDLVVEVASALFFSEDDTRTLAESGGRRGTAVIAEGKSGVLYERPGNRTPQVSVIENGERLAAVGKPFGGMADGSLLTTHLLWIPVVTESGEVGWMDSSLVQVEVPPEELWGSMDTRETTVTARTPVWRARPSIDPARPEPGSSAQRVGYLEPGMKVARSEQVWKRVSVGWMGLAGQEGIRSELPDELKPLADSLVVVKIPGESALGWAGGWLDAPVSTPTTTTTTTSAVPAPVPTTARPPLDTEKAKGWLQEKKERVKDARDERRESSPAAQFGRAVALWQSVILGGLAALFLASALLAARARVTGVRRLPTGPVGMVMRLAPLTFGTVLAAAAAAVYGRLWLSGLAAVAVGVVAAIRGAAVNRKRFDFQSVSLPDGLVAVLAGLMALAAIWVWLGMVQGLVVGASVAGGVLGWLGSQSGFDLSSLPIFKTLTNRTTGSPDHGQKPASYDDPYPGDSTTVPAPGDKTSSSPVQETS